MNKRDLAKLEQLVRNLSAYFADPSKQSYTGFLGRGHLRALAAIIREHKETET